jgi:hypothetical protein
VAVSARPTSIGMLRLLINRDLTKMVLGARVSGPAEFEYRVDSRVCMLVSA